MATAISDKWTSTSPQIQMTVEITNDAPTTATLSWKLQYVASSPASAVKRKYYASIAGTQVTSGWFAIDGITGTHTIASGTKEITKTKAKQTISFSGTMEMNLTWSGVYGGTKTASGSIVVSAKKSYTITYNHNGASGSSTVTQYHDEAVTIKAAISRTGYTFNGWGTTKSGGTIYQPGDKYTPNATRTLFAIWEPNTYKITYNANGEGASLGKVPNSATKTHDTPLKLSTEKPTRTNYTFKGWSTSKTATTATYAAGDNYTANKAATLYAVWELAYVKPKITKLNISRCNSNGTPDESGTYGLVSFAYACEQTLKSIVVRWESETGGSGSETISASGASGNISKVVGSGSLNTEYTYTVTVVVTDAVDDAYAFGTLPGTKFVVDFKSGGAGVAFGKPAELEEVLDIAFQTRHYGGLLPIVLEPETDLDEIIVPNTYVGADLSRNNYTCGDKPLPITSGTFTLEVVSMGEEGQRKQRLAYCGKTNARAWERIRHKSSGSTEPTWGDWVCVSDFDGQLLWSGVYYMSASQTAQLAEPISKQRSGIVLVFSRYSDGTAQNYHFQTFFVPKYQVQAHHGCGHTFMLTTDASFGLFAAKYLYINDTSIVGNDINTTSGTGTCGITYTNNGFVLRYVIGV